MNEFITNHPNELLSTIICLAVLLMLKFAASKAIRKIGRISELNKARTKLIIKYASFLLSVIGFVALTFIWKVDFKDLGLLLTSIFTVIGVALFASWSILSNVTAGVILFFSFPFKIGDRIKIHDADIPEEAVIGDIKAFHVYLKKDNGELITYPNNLLLQKGVTLIQKEDDSSH
ncbi:small-conductance mechanosensitive channel [Saonia flava]|uniref:Small-conductance mechanosensitive channel n=1 Tax=Saonia flava TaxID=523696 RepID=A0A846QX21_9FLAO|nr:mechanosensitive ion channel domain-containing protein [Saonia flava]NJB70165.1 small-conductance mechanosensitive channel [Saonia flava]